MLALVLSLNLLSACSQSGGFSSDKVGPEDTPIFEGTYAEEYRQAWTNSDEPFVREVIRDQKVTDQELAEAVKRLGDCFDSQGMELLEYEHDGAYSVDPGEISGERSNELMVECENSSGEAVLGRLRYSEQTNPENRDIDEIMHECLVRVGAVPASYSIEEYRHDNPTYDFPFVVEDGSALYDKCVAEPLTAQQ